MRAFVCTFALGFMNIRTESMEGNLRTWPCSEKPLLPEGSIRSSSTTLLHTALAHIHLQPKRSLPSLCGLSFSPMPILRNPNMVPSEFQASVGIVASAWPPPEAGHHSPHDLMIMSFGGHLTDKDRCCFWGKGKKTVLFFPPGSRTFFTNVILSLTFTAPIGSLVIPLVLISWMERLSHTPGLIRRLEHRELFLILDYNCISFP